MLVYAHRQEFPQHPDALETLNRLMRGTSPWGLPVFALSEYLRVVTHPRYLDPPTPANEALSNLDSLLESPSVRLLTPGRRFWTLLRRAVKDGGATGNLIFDAQIVAVCHEHGVDTILTEDRDFLRFSGIKAHKLADQRLR